MTAPIPPATWVLERAWVEGAVLSDVLVEIANGRFVTVRPGARHEARADRVPGLTLPGFANTHSHVFHRALRGRTQRGAGTFWTWREQMYAVAARLDPDSLYRLARAVYAEMVAAGWTAVGEFHYLHHQPDGAPYQDPNAMGRALVAAAEDVGLRLTLLDTCYLAGGIGEPLGPAQRRFGDADAERWAARVDELAETLGPDRGPDRGPDHGPDHRHQGRQRVGAAVHSVRAVPPDALGKVAAWASERAVPLHVHLSEQIAENERCRAAYGCTPTQLLDDHGVLGPRTTAVHATHLSEDDIARLARTGTTVSVCPTTERDLGDGIGPAYRLAAARVPLTLGSDSHAVIDPFEEMRALELDERLATQRRGHFTPAELLAAATGHASLGVADAGRIAVGQRADLVTVDTASVRTAGTGGDEHMAIYAATAADVRRVMIDGRLVFEGDHAAVGHRLADAIGRVWA